MKFVTDVNIILSSLIKDSVTRKILIDGNFEFYFPKDSFEKIRKYESYVINKSGLTRSEYFKLLSRILINIHLVKKSKLKKYWNEAKRIMQKIDEEDVVFIACALLLGKKSVIWSDDKDFEKQKTIPFIKTQELIKRFGIN